QQMNGAAVGFSLQDFGKLWQGVPVELVIAQNIYDRFGRKEFSCPLAPFATKMNVTRQHDDIGIDRTNLGCSKFQVQIAKDVQAHSEIKFQSIHRRCSARIVSAPVPLGFGHLDDLFRQLVLRTTSNGRHSFVARYDLKYVLKASRLLAKIG